MGIEKREASSVNMIRKFDVADVAAVMQIWLKANMDAHDFIEATYWRGKYAHVQNMLPDATLFVCEEGHAIVGFIGLLESYIAGIFVDPAHQSKGMGKALLDHVKKNHSKLTLQVYQKNARAVGFYLREGFAILSEQTDDNTGETELVMLWQEQARALPLAR